MNATTITPTVHSSAARPVSDIAVITRRNLLFTVRLPQVLVLSSIMPVIFIVMFTYVFGGAIQGALPPAAAGRYVNWLIPGLLAQFALFGGSATASGLAEDLAKGVIDRFRSLPMAGAAVLAGRTLSDLVRSALTLTLMLAVGFAIGFRPQTPTQTMPGWLQAFAANQPVTVATNALRSLILGQGALPSGQTMAGQVVLALVWAGAIIAVFAPLAVRAYRRTVR